MDHVLHWLGRWLVVIALGVLTFLPEIGVLPMSLKLFSQWPVPVIVCDMIWAVAIALALPLTLPQFRVISTVAITAIIGAGLWTLWQSWPEILFGVSWWPWWMWAVLSVSIVIGWLMICTPLWRWARGTQVVQQNDPSEIGNDHIH